MNISSLLFRWFKQGVLPIQGEKSELVNLLTVCFVYSSPGQNKATFLGHTLRPEHGCLGGPSPCSLRTLCLCSRFRVECTALELHLLVLTAKDSGQIDACQVSQTLSGHMRSALTLSGQVRPILQQTGLLW